MINITLVRTGLLAAALVASGSWTAQSAPNTVLAQAADTKPAAEADTTTTGNAAGGASGANSFTENQAKSRIQDAGFSNVTALKQDDKGVWRGTATKDGKSVPVGLDFKGNVTGQ